MEKVRGKGYVSFDMFYISFKLRLYTEFYEFYLILIFYTYINYRVYLYVLKGYAQFQNIGNFWRVGRRWRERVRFRQNVALAIVSVI